MYVNVPKIIFIDVNKLVYRLRFYFETKLLNGTMVGMSFYCFLPRVDLNVDGKMFENYGSTYRRAKLLLWPGFM